MITSEHYKYLETWGISKIEADRQIAKLLKGTTYSRLHKPATPGDGIRLLSPEEIDAHIRHFLTHKKEVSLIKFVPASGAATRMFSEVAQFVTSKQPTPAITHLLEQFNQLPFAHLVPTTLNDVEKLSYLLRELGYGTTPKGLIPFHSYGTYSKTAFEEHWVEAAMYAAQAGQAAIHFTISPAYAQGFKAVAQAQKQGFEQSYGIQLHIAYSNQDPATDTLCLTNDNSLVQTPEGKPLLRPGGHGALLNNLQQLPADMVFIKNIDNVTHLDHIGATLRYKKALGGLLLSVKDKVFEALKKLDANNIAIASLEKLGKELHINWPKDYPQWDTLKQASFWKNKLNRPIRVCGMVKNEGEPGGGPFWVENSQGEISLQIVETAQVDTLNPEQEAILAKATHFNPVDLVCYLTNYLGEPFNLMDYRDENTAFITSKTLNTQEIKVLEHPGLWNGAMADWITLFVEVDATTFNPVKTVNDLLKSAHHGVI